MTQRKGHSFDFSALLEHLPPNTGPAGTVPVSNGPGSGPNGNKNLSHVPCKFHRQGNCQAGSSCPFSHSLDGSLAANKLPCKYFQKGNCKFGLKCALAHFLPDGTRVNSRQAKYRKKNNPPALEQPLFLDKPENPDFLQRQPLFLEKDYLVATDMFSVRQEDLSSPENSMAGLNLVFLGFPFRNNAYTHLPLYYSPPSVFLKANESALVDDESEDYDDDDSALFEDYVPASLGNLILTPQERERRNSRSQLGTLLVRPSVRLLPEARKVPQGDVFIME